MRFECFLFILLKLCWAENVYVTFTRDMGIQKVIATRTATSMPQCAQYCINTPACLAFQLIGSLCQVSSYVIMKSQPGVTIYFLKRGWTSCPQSGMCTVSDDPLCLQNVSSLPCPFSGISAVRDVEWEYYRGSLRSGVTAVNCKRDCADDSTCGGVEYRIGPETCYNLITTYSPGLTVTTGSVAITIDVCIDLKAVTFKKMVHYYYKTNQTYYWGEKPSVPDPGNLILNPTSIPMFCYSSTPAAPYLDALYWNSAGQKLQIGSGDVLLGYCSNNGTFGAGEPVYPYKNNATDIYGFLYAYKNYQITTNTSNKWTNQGIKTCGFWPDMNC